MNGWQNGKVYLQSVAACFAVCGVCKVAIVTIFVVEKDTLSITYERCLLSLEMTLKPTTELFSHTRPVHSGVVTSSQATEKGGLVLLKDS